MSHPLLPRLRQAKLGLAVGACIKTAVQHKGRLEHRHLLAFQIWM